MEVKKLEVLGYDVEFINETWETRNSWGHKSTLLINGDEYGSNKVRYYNRTWESYRYQTCMKGVLYQLMNELKSELLAEYKEKNAIVRMNAKRTEDFENTVLNVNDRYSLYKAIREAL